MNNLDRLIEFLNVSLSKHADDPEVIGDWLERARNDGRCIQLAACMGVDLLSGVPIGPVIANLITTAHRLVASHDSLTASELFQLAMDGYPQDKLLCARAVTSLLPTSTYARVLDFVDFLDFYAPYKATSVAEMEKARRIYAEGASLGFVRATWRGRLPIVWVTDHNELESIMNSGPSDGLVAARVARRLGLNKPTNTFGLVPEYVAIKYPKNVPTPLFKPTLMDQVWNSEHRFVSSLDPEWGEMLPLPPDTEGVSERVHPALEAGLTDEYTLHHMGQCLSLLSNTDVADRALERFVECLASLGRGRGA